MHIWRTVAQDTAYAILFLWHARAGKLVHDVEAAAAAAAAAALDAVLADDDSSNAATTFSSPSCWRRL